MSAQGHTAPDDAYMLGLTLDGMLFDEFCQRPSWRFGGWEFELEDSDVGEPFTLRRKSDGRRFEVELEATVREVTP